MSIDGFIVSTVPDGGLIVAAQLHAQTDCPLGNEESEDGKGMDSPEKGLTDGTPVGVLLGSGSASKVGEFGGAVWPSRFDAAAVFRRFTKVGIHCGAPVGC